MTQIVGVLRNKTGMIKVRFMQLGVTVYWQEKDIISNFKMFWRKFSDIPTKIANICGGSGGGGQY
jgi:hypothetical protein